MGKKQFFFLICALISGFLLGSLAAKEETPTVRETFAKAPYFKGVDLVTQKEMSLKNFDGNVLLIKFGTTW